MRRTARRWLWGCIGDWGNGTGEFGREGRRPKGTRRTRPKYTGRRTERSSDGSWECRVGRGTFVSVSQGSCTDPASWQLDDGGWRLRGTAGFGKIIGRWTFRRARRGRSSRGSTEIFRRRGRAPAASAFGTGGPGRALGVRSSWEARQRSEMRWWEDGGGRKRGFWRSDRCCWEQTRRLLSST